MKKKLILLAAAAAASMTFLSAGVAGAQPKAPSMVGKTFSEASQKLTWAGFKAIPSTMIGDQLPQSQCVVTNQQDVPPPPSFGGAPFVTIPARAVLLSLNCDAKAASATNPGFSAANPDGKLVQDVNGAKAARAGGSQAGG